MRPALSEVMTMSDFHKLGHVATVLIDGLPGQPDPLLSAEERLEIAREGIAERYGAPVGSVGVIELGPEQMQKLALAMARWEDELRAMALECFKPDDKAMHDTMTVALLGVLGGVMLESIPLAPKVNGTHIAKALLDGMRTVVDALAKAEREGGAS